MSIRQRTRPRTSPPSPASVSERPRRGLSVADGASILFMLALFIIGAPLDGRLGRFSVDTLGPLDPVVLQQLAAANSGSVLPVAVVWGTFYLAAFAMLLMRFGGLVRLIRAAPLVAVFFGYYAISTLWSDAPLSGLTDIAQLIGSLLVCALVALRYEGDGLTFVRHVALALGTAQLANTVLTLLLPHLTIAPNGRWTGVYGAPNYFGSLAFVSLWANLAVVALMRRRLRAWYLLLALASTVNLAATNSVTSMICLLTALAAYWIWPILAASARRPVNMAVMLAGVGMIAILLATGLLESLAETILATFGRSTNLTGRSAIWAEAYTAITASPVVGRGFGTKLELTSINWLTDLHSGYLQALFAGGMVGVSLLLGMILQAGAAAWHRQVRDQQQTALLVSILVATLTYNLSETAFFNARSPVFIMLAASLFMLSLLPRALARQNKPRAR